MFGFLKRSREDAKKEGRLEAFGEVGNAIAQMFQNEMAEFMQETARPNLQQCVNVFELRTEQNIFVNPAYDLKPQQILKKEWDFFQELIIVMGKKIKDGIDERTGAMIKAVGPVDEESSAMLRARYHSELVILLNETDEAGKAHLAVVLDRIHAHEKHRG